MENFNPNWVSILVTSLVPLIIGFVWYNPKIFGSIWMQHANMTEEKVKQMNPMVVYGLSLVLSFILATAMAFMGRGDGAEPHYTSSLLIDGLMHGSMLALSVIMPVLTTNALFEQKSFQYILVNLGYWWLTLALMAAVLSVL